MQVPSVTMVDAVLPRSGGLMREVMLVVGGALGLAILAQVSAYLPFTPVPITGQTLGVLLVGALLGSRRGALSMLTYLGEGLIGLPVFAGGATAWTPSVGGVPYIVGPTAGYLLGFPAAAFAVGVLAERGCDRHVVATVAMMALGNVLIYVPGLVWLAQYVGMDRVLVLGLIPYLPGDILKIALAAALLPAGWRLIPTSKAASRSRPCGPGSARGGSDC